MSEFKSALNNLIEKNKKWFIFDRDHLPFRGSILENEFWLRRIIHYKNSFLPTIYGKIIPTSEGTTIDLRIRLTIPQIILTIFWYSFDLILILIFPFSELWGILLFVSIILPFIMLLVPIIAFRIEANKAIEILKEILL
ncbi:hypothetical protein EHQ52_17070 [Leptospira koniambonensis]|uniref:Uncharacterized protein n=1 Tax=Leptospira koniambonensis TaxID=2484950 RepID=A0A4R9J5R3_9LEPT|nr:hypothetical protein [Leptospira koniambonensis]TGL31638.1 hypothetical protein EHQ52_17070 [Leptospira koniambonensis]